MPKLTKRLVDAIRPAKTEVVVWDSELRGFGFRVRPSGHRSFIVQYRNAQGRSRKVKVGEHGRLTPDEARREARLILAEVERGGDPAEELQKERQADSVRELVAAYLERHLIPKKRQSTVSEYARLLEKVILPRLGDRKVADVTRRDVEALHRDMRGTPTQANRALALLSSLMVYAERVEERPAGSNPCRYIEKYPEAPRNRYPSASELARLGEVLAEAERSGSGHPSAILAIRLLALSGMRRGEVLSLKWGDVDFQRSVADLPTSKTGAKRVSLGAPVLELLSRAARAEGNPYVVAGERRGAPLVGLQKIWERLRHQAGLDDVRLHDLRHGYASAGAAGGESLLVIGRLLGHATAAMTDRYSHLSPDPLRSAADRISSKIAADMQGQPGGDVVSIDQARGGQ
jgi:integrase